MRSLLFAVMLLAQSSNPAQVQTGTITGRLLALDGTPAAGVRVSAMPAADPAKPSAANSTDGTVLASLTQTDASGRYRLENIPPGRYYVLAGFVDSPTYFPGVTTTAAATSVSIAARATVAGIDFQASRLSTGLNLKGRLKRDSNEGVGGLSIFLSGNDQYPNVRSLPDGSFEFLKLKPGSYSVSVSTPNFPPQQIVLTDKDISNLEFVIPWTVDVSGNVSTEGGGMRPNLTLTFAGGSRGISSTNARDTFRITLPEGAYAVAANGIPSGFFIKSIKSGSADLLSEPLKLSRTSPPPAIAVTLGVSTPPPWVKLTGRVTGLPMPRADTRLSLNGPVTETLESIVGADGSFEFPKLLPGTYSIRINPSPLSMPQPSIIVPNSDLAGVLISFPAVKEITGRVSIENGGPLPVTSLNLTGTFGLSVDSGQATLAQLLVASAQPRNSMTVNLSLQNDGTFKASLPEGQYRISATPQFRNANGSVYAVKAFTYGATDLTRDSVSVTATDSASMNLSFGPTSTIAWSKVTGRVTGLDSSFLAANPLMVTLNSSGLVTNWTSNIKPDGSFEFPKVYPGNYTARIALTGATQNPGSIGNLNFNVATATINLIGADITGVEIAVPRQKDITGKVTLEGRGLMPRFTIPLASLPGASIPQVQYISINPLLDGSFNVTIMEGERQVGVASSLPAGYALKSMTYGTTDVLKNPLKVAMSDSAELRVTLTTPNLAPVRVSGKLTGVDDLIFARGPVTATMIGIGNIASLLVPIHPDRSFEFPEVFPGAYSVRATGAGILNSPNVPVSVANTNITNIEIAVPRQREIAGRVILDGLAPMPRFQISSVPSAPPAGMASSAPTGSSTMLINPQADGAFRLTLLVGEHSMGPVIGLPTGYTIKSFTYGAADLLKNPLKVGDKDTDELRIAITTPIRPPVQVRGRVSGLDASAFAKGTVIVTMTSATYVSALSAPVITDGTFEFPDVFPGSFSARVIGPGILNSPSVPVVVAGTNTPIIEIALPRQKEITGHVVLEGSGPMPRMVIPLMSTTAGPGAGSTLVQGQIPGRLVVPAPGMAPGLLPGPTPGAASSISINPQTDGTFRVTLLEGEQRVGPAIGLPPGYALKSLTYGSIDLLKNTFKIATSDTDELRVVVSSSSPTPVRVRGRVIGLDAASFARGPVNASMTSPMYGLTLNAEVRADGTFEFPTVYPGVFSLRTNGISVLASPNVTVTVANADVGDVEIRVPNLKDITGHVTIEGGGPYPLFALPLASLPPAIGAPGVSGTLPTIRPSTDGTFHIGLPAGESRIANFVGLPPGYTVKSLAYGSTDLLKNPLKIEAADTLELQISLVNSATPVRVSGRVEGVDLIALAKTPVRVTMTSPSFMVPLTVDVRPDGTFEFSKVYPGNYRILAETGPSPSQRLSTPLTVGDREITELVVTIPK